MCAIDQSYIFLKYKLTSLIVVLLYIDYVHFSLCDSSGIPLIDCLHLVNSSPSSQVHA